MTSTFSPTSSDREGVEPVVVPVREADLDPDVLAFDVAEVAEAGPKRVAVGRTLGRRREGEIADPGDPALLLRARGERARHRRRAAELRDEAPPPHSITSSARPSRLGGIV